MILILPSHGVEGWVDLGTAVMVHSPYPRLYIAAAVAINTTVCSVIRTMVFSHRSRKRKPIGYWGLHSPYTFQWAGMSPSEVPISVGIWGSNGILIGSSVSAQLAQCTEHRHATCDVCGKGLRAGDAATSATANDTDSYRHWNSSSVRATCRARAWTILCTITSRGKSAKYATGIR